MRRLQQSRSSGFSLIELAAVIAIMAMLTGAFLTVATSHKEHENQVVVGTHLDEIEKALLYYRKQFGSLPGPAQRTDPEGSANFGKQVTYATATPASIVEVLSAGGVVGKDEIRIGVVPVRTLGLRDSYMYDEWGDRITYAVVKELTDPIQYAAYVAALDATPATATALTTGVIKITDVNDNQINKANIKSVVAYALVSHGKDKGGAYNRRGTTPVPVTCVAAAEDGENCDDDSIFVDSAINDSTTTASYYYDYVRWKDLQYIITASSRPTSMTTTAPPAVTGIWSQIVTGQKHSCGLKTDGTVWCWGDETSGQIGNGITTGNLGTPYNIASLTDITQITAASNFNCALKSSTNRIYCWGDGTQGQLGDNSSNSSSVPVLVINTNLTNPVQVDTGDDDSCAIQDAGADGDNSNDTVYCWGRNQNGEAGDNSSGGSKPAPVQVCKTSAVAGVCTTGLTGVKFVSAGGDHACAVVDTNADGVDEAWCWGDQTSGGLGHDKSATSPQGLPLQVCSPTEVSTNNNACDAATPYLLNVMKIATGHAYSCAILTTGATYCWGNQKDGRLGNGLTASTNVRVATLVNGGGFAIDGTAGHAAVDIALSLDTSNDKDFTCAVMDDGSLRCWGGNTVGKLGYGDNVTASTGNPQKVLNAAATPLPTVTSIDVGADHVCAVADLNADGTPEAYCWGESANYRLGNNDLATDHKYADTGPP